MEMKKSVWAWLSAVLLIVLLYLGGPAVYFNRVYPLIFGMPALYFWFVLVPFLNPVILGILYLYDRKWNAQQSIPGEKER